MRSILVFISSLLCCHSLHAEPIQSRIGHFYWALGPNFSPLGNVRLGFGNIELGVLQGTGLGVVYVHRTSSPLFLQIGPVSTNGGVGLIGGGGLEWNTFSFFRFRTDITAKTDGTFRTEGFVSIGGVLIL